jgi:sporulation protein YlmC with PRC-barrel domain
LFRLPTWIVAIALLQSTGCATFDRHAPGWSRMPVSEMIGTRVTNREGQDLGRVTDLMLDLEGRQVRYAILEFRGMAVPGEKLFAYPVRAFQPGGGQDRLMLNVGSGQLEGAEGFHRNRFPPGDDPYWGRAERALEAREGVAASAAAPDAGRPAHEIAPPSFVRASRVIGTSVRDPAGTGAGEVSDLIVNLQTGAIEHVVVKRNGRAVRIPMKALSASATGDELRLSAELPGAPTP